MKIGRETNEGNKHFTPRCWRVAFSNKGWPLMDEAVEEQN